MTESQEELRRRGVEMQARLPGYDRPDPERKDSKFDAAADTFAAADLALEAGAAGLLVGLVAFLAWLLGRRPKR